MIPVEQILEGIAMAMTWKGVAMIALGVFAGITVGAIPGINGVMATAILVPFSFFMAPVLGIPFLLGIHKGATFGGAIPAILVNTPGVTTADLDTFVFNRRRIPLYPFEEPVYPA